MLGLSLSQLLQQQSAASPSFRPSVPRIRSLILIDLEGGLSHIDSLDIKPESPDTVRSAFEPIATAISGVQFSEHVPRLAARANKFALVRSMSHQDAGHPSATHKLITGATLPNIPEDAARDKHAGRDDFPCYAAGVSYFRSDLSRNSPGGVHLPEYIRGAFDWPGQNAGFLGARYDPLQLRNDRSDFDYSQPGFRRCDGITVSRIQNRRQLLQEFNRQRGQLEHEMSAGSFSKHQERAFAMLDSPRLARAFDLEEESESLREAYGKHYFGQSLLLARRLVEAQIPVIQANLRGWDTHVNGFATLKDSLLPKFDQALSTFLDDMAVRGMLEETLVVVTGEFGRKPTITTEPGHSQPGRDHWPSVYSAIFLGGGVRVGQVIGASDRLGGEPTSDPFTPYDLGATIYEAFGIDPSSVIRDTERKRTFQLSQGKVIRPLYEDRPST